MADTVEKKNVAKYTPEDFARMTRLCEEIEGRLTEMAMIMARTMATKNPDFKNILNQSPPPILQYCKTWNGKDITKQQTTGESVCVVRPISGGFTFSCGVHDTNCQCSYTTVP